MTALARDRSLGDSQAGTALDEQHPWPGLVSFTEKQCAFFHGRDEKLDELFGRVTNTMLTVLFGESGLGKTSLLQAGLFPWLRRAGFLPMLIRLDPAAAMPYADQVKEVLRQALKEAGRAELTPRKETNLWEHFHQRGAGRDDDAPKPMPIVLVFDQFEELFSHSHRDEAARITDFFTELGDLVENRIPAALRKAIEGDPRRMKEFDFRRQDYRVLLSLREDYLARLEELRGFLPAILENRMRLMRMNGVQALEAVTEPGAGIISTAAARQVVRFVAGAAEAKGEVSAMEVEPWLLSLVCFELNVQRLQQKLPRITEDLLAGSRDQILQKFYQDCLRDQPPGMRVFIEEDLLTHDLRDSVELEKAEQILAGRGVGRLGIRALVQRRLLHLESRRGMQRVELAHDVLVKVVKKSRDERRQHEAQRELTETLRKNRRRVQWLAAAVFVAVGIIGMMGALAVLAWSKTQEANSAKHVAEQAKHDAEQSLEQKKAALRRAEESTESAQRALEGRNLALKNAESAKLAAERSLENEKAALTNLADANYTNSVSLAYRERSTGNMNRFEALLNKCPPEKRSWDWDFLKGLGHKELFSLHDESPLYAVAFSPDGRWLAYSGDRKSIVLRKAATGELVHNLPSVSAFAAVSFLAQLAFPYGGIPYAEARALYPQAHQNTVLALAFSPDGLLLASASTDKTVRVYDVLQGKEVYLLNHGDQVSGVAFSPDGRRIASISKEPYGQGASTSGTGTVKVWDLHGTTHFQAPSSSNLMSGLAFDPYGHLLACPTENGLGVAIWNVSTKKKELPDLLGHNARVYGIAFSPNGRYVASAGQDATVKIWDTKIARKLSGDSEIYSTGALVRNFNHDDFVSCVAFSPDGARVASGSWDQSAKVWDVLTGREMNTYRGHTHLVLGVSFSADGGYLASAGYDGSVKVWETDQPQNFSTVLGPASAMFFHGVAFDPTGKKLIGSSVANVRTDLGGVEIWDADTTRRIGSLNQPGDWGTVAVSSDGRFIAAGEGMLNPRGAKSGRIAVWDAQKQTLYKMLLGHADWVTAVAFRPGTTELASAGRDGAIKIWDVTRDVPPRDLRHVDPKKKASPTVPIWGLAFSPDGKLLASAGDDRTVRLWHAATGAPCKAPLEGHTLPVRCVAFASDGRQVISGAGDTLNAGQIIVWGQDHDESQPGQTGARDETWKILHRLPNVRGSVTGLAVHPHANLLAASSFNRSVMIYDLSRGDELFTLGGFQFRLTAIAWQPGEGRHLACADGSDITVWSVNPSPERFALRGQTRRINSVAFSSDGKKLASVSNDATVQIWDTRKGESDGPPVERRDRSSYSDAIAWSRDDKLLAYDNGRSVRIRNLADGTVLRDLALPELANFLAFSPDGKLLAVAADQNLRVFDAATWEQLHVLKGHSRRISSLAFSPSGRLLASAGQDASVKIWDPHAGKELNDFRGHTASVQEVTFLDETRVASAGKDKTVRIWDPLANPARTYHILKGHMVPIWSVAYDPIEKKIVSTDEIGLIKVWNADTGREVATVRGHSGSVGFVTYSAKARLFATAGTDTTVRLWDMSRLQAGPAQSQERARWVSWYEREGLWHRDLALKDGMLDIEGVLLATDPLDRLNRSSFSKIYAVKLAAGKSYQIDMIARSFRFDPFLRVEDAQGNELAKDDQSGRNDNARIVFSCPKTATYHIIANTFYQKQTGPFRLHLEEVPPSAVIPIVLNDGAGQVEGSVTSTDPKDPVLIASSSKTYSVELAGGAFYGIDMIATGAGNNRLNAVLRLEDAAGKELAQNGVATNGNARILFSCSQSGAYRIVATTPREQQGPFSLVIRKSAPNFLTLKDGAAETNDKLSAADLRDRLNRTSPCKAYFVKMTADTTYYFEMTSAQFPDTVLRLEDAQGKVLAAPIQDGPIEKGRSRLVFTCPHDDICQLVATNISGKSGAFVLSARVLPLSPATPLAWKNGAAEVKAELTAADPKDRVAVDSPCKAYSLPLTAGTVYQLDMTTAVKGVDPWLRLEDSHGKPLTQFRGFQSTLARILFLCPRDGDYRVITTTNHGRTGAFTFVARSAVPTSLALNDGAALVKDKLGADDLRDRFKLDCPVKIYLVKLTANKTYEIDTSSSKTLGLHFRVEDDEGKGLSWSQVPVPDTSSFADGAKARLIFDCRQDGVYRILVASDGPTGPYVLNVRPFAITLEPATPLALTDGAVVVNAELTTKDPKDRLRITSPCKICSLEMVAGKTYQIDMITKTEGFDPFLRLEDSQGKQLAEDDDSGGFPNARIVFACQRSGVYRIIATAFAKTGAYQLKIEEK